MKRRVLIADDDFDNREITKEALEMAADLEVLVAMNGEQAVEMAQQANPDLILLDMSMPKMNGWEAASRIRKLPTGGGMILIAYTAHAMAGDDVKARAAGCDDYLSKPCDPREIVRKVKSWLQAREGNKNA